MKLLVLLSLLVSLLSCASKKNTVKTKDFYGEKILAKKATSLSKVLANYPKYEGKDVVMEANVNKVCAKKGCWMILQGPDKTFRVKFHDYSFFVPMSLIGKKVWIEGRVTRKKVSVKDVKHYLEDAGASKSEIDAVKGPTYEYRIIAKGVREVR